MGKLKPRCKRRKEAPAKNNICDLNYVLPIIAHTRIICVRLLIGKDMAVLSSESTRIEKIHSVLATIRTRIRPFAAGLACRDDEMPHWDGLSLQEQACQLHWSLGNPQRLVRFEMLAWNDTPFEQDEIPEIFDELAEKVAKGLEEAAGVPFRWWFSATASDEGKKLKFYGVLDVGGWDLAIITHALVYRGSMLEYYHAHDYPHFWPVTSQFDMGHYIRSVVPAAPEVGSHSAVLAPGWMLHRCKELYRHQRAWLVALAQADQLAPIR